MVAPAYITEVSEPSVRGALATLLNLAATSGQVLVNGLNVYGFATWQAITVVCLFIPG